MICDNCEFNGLIVHNINGRCDNCSGLNWKEETMEESDRLELALFKAADQVYDVNVANGWFDENRTFGDDIALLHSEVSEMLEAYRDHGIQDATQKTLYVDAPLQKPEGVGSEAADVLVRLLDTCKRYDINLGAEFKRKMEYNATRGFRHGGKKL